YAAVLAGGKAESLAGEVDMYGADGIGSACDDPAVIGNTDQFPCRWILSVITRGNPYLMSQQAMGLALWQRSRFGCSGFLQCCLGAEILGIAMPKFRHALHP